MTGRTRRVVLGRLKVMEPNISIGEVARVLLEEQVGRNSMIHKRI